MREFHAMKGLLFQYDRWHSNWLYSCCAASARGRPSALLQAASARRPHGRRLRGRRIGQRVGSAASRAACCPTTTRGCARCRCSRARRQVVQQRSDIAAQVQAYREIQAMKESRAHVAIARADALKEAEEGVAIKAPRGNRSQWHSNFKDRRVRARARDIPVVQKDEATGATVPGLLLILPGQTLQDGCKMLLTELQLGPTAAEGGFGSSRRSRPTARRSLI